MSQTIRTLALASALVIGAALSSAQAAEREQVRMVINLIAGVKMPFPQNLHNNLSRTERVAPRHQWRNGCLPASR